MDTRVVRNTSYLYRNNIFIGGGPLSVIHELLTIDLILF